MPRKPELLTASAAARALGISLDTLRRWDASGRIATTRDDANRRMVPASEVARLTGKRSGSKLSARNQLEASVTSVEIDGLLAQVEMVVQRGSRVVAVITRDSAIALGLKPGANVRAVVKATSVLVER